MLKRIFFASLTFLFLVNIISAAEFGSTYPTLIDAYILPEAGPTGTLFLITAELYDVSGVESASVKIIKDNVTIETIPMQASGDIWSAQWDSSGAASGIHKVNLTACDTYTNCGEFEEVTVFGIDACSDGTLPSDCSITRPKKCNQDLILEDTCSECSCPTDYICSVDGSCIGQCSDGTLSGQCSSNEPFYCDNGNLIEDCNNCGCPLGNYECKSDGSCLLSCSDDTPSGECSLTQPEYCMNGNLVDDCEICGCPDLYGCMNDSKCYLVSCSDGTPIGECSVTIPKYCDEYGNLVDDTEKCPLESPTPDNGEEEPEQENPDHDQIIIIAAIIIIVLIIILLLFLFVL